MKRKDIIELEKKSTNINMLPLFLMAAGGLVFGNLALSQAIVLDGSFSFVLFITIFIAKIVQKWANKPRTFFYPTGKTTLEPLYVVFKLVILLTILSITFFEATYSLYEYYFKDVKPEEVVQIYANAYYVVKLVAFAASYFIYTKYFYLSKKKSEILKVDRMSVLIDGGITVAIFLGFLVLGNIPSLAAISDSLILLLLSIFLFIHVMNEFIHEINIILGKRCYIAQEAKYMALFNNYFSNLKVSDIYIRASGKMFIVTVTAQYEGTKSLEDLKHFTKDIKRLMYDEFDQIYLNLYWDVCAIEYHSQNERDSLLTELHM